MSRYVSVPGMHMYKRFFYFIPAFLIATLIGIYAAFGVDFWSFLIGMGFIFIFIVFSKPLYGFYIVFVTSVLTRYPTDVFGFSIRADQIGVIFLLSIFTLRHLIGREVKKGERILSSIVLDYESIFLLGWVLTNYLASVLNAEDPLRSIRICIWISISVLTFLLTRYVSIKYVHPLRLLQAFVILGSAEASYGLLAYLSASMFGTTIGVQVDPITKYIGAYGTMWEANIFGSFTMAIGLQLLGYILSKRNSHYVYIGLFLIAVIAMITSMTRGAWLGFAIGVTLLLFRIGVNNIFEKRVFTIIMTLVFLAVFFTAVGYTQQVVSRITAALDYTSGSIGYRLSNIGLAFEDWVQSPVIGLGTNSFGQRHMDPTRNQPGYIGSLLIQTLYDTGIIGFIMLSSFFGSILIRLHKVCQTKAIETRGIILGAIAAIIGLLVAYEATSAIWFSYNWILLGIYSELSRAYRREQN